MAKSNILTPIQVTFLKLLGNEKSLSDKYYLTGGTGQRLQNFTSHIVFQKTWISFQKMKLTCQKLQPLYVSLKKFSIEGLSKITKKIRRKRMAKLFH
jgi:hypothetical protein